jgi:hypothetical protein
MKFTLAILVATVLLSTFMLVMLTSFLLTEFEFLQNRKRESD